MVSIRFYLRLFGGIPLNANGWVLRVKTAFSEFFEGLNLMTLVVLCLQSGTDRSECVHECARAIFLNNDYGNTTMIEDI